MKRLNFITKINYASLVPDDATRLLPYYIGAARAMDSLVGNKIILIDYHNGCMPYVPDDFPSTNNNAVIDIESHVKKIFSDKQLQENSEIDSAFYSLLRTMNREQRTQCILHSDVRIQLKGNVTILHRALKPYVLDRNGDVWLALCAFSFSSRSETGNAIIKMEHSSCHYQYTNGKWEVITNPKLTKIESKILGSSDKSCDKVCLM